MQFFQNDWDDVLGEEFEKDYFKTIIDKVEREYATHKIYPAENKIFSAFKSGNSRCTVSSSKVC